MLSRLNISKMKINVMIIMQIYYSKNSIGQIKMSI